MSRHKSNHQRQNIRRQHPKLSLNQIPRNTTPRIGQPRRRRRAPRSRRNHTWSDSRQVGLGPFGLLMPLAQTAIREVIPILPPPDRLPLGMTGSLAGRIPTGLLAITYPRVRAKQRRADATTSSSPGSGHEDIRTCPHPEPVSISDTTGWFNSGPGHFRRAASGNIPGEHNRVISGKR